MVGLYAVQLVSRTGELDLSNGKGLRYGQGWLVRSWTALAPGQAVRGGGHRVEGLSCRTTGRRERFGALEEGTGWSTASMYAPHVQ